MVSITATVIETTQCFRATHPCRNDLLGDLEAFSPIPMLFDDTQCESKGTLHKDHLTANWWMWTSKYRELNREQVSGADEQVNLRFSGREFQSYGALTKEARSPFVFSLVLGTAGRTLPEDL
ncbi:hypothetical protein NQZ68_016402, partial [Dissostichus eleginoides]